MGNAAPTLGAKEGQTGGRMSIFHCCLSCCLVIKIFDQSLIFPYSVAMELTRD